jgi:hypothetical protein
MKILGIDKLFFHVGDLQEGIRFYKRLGFALKFQIPRIKAALFKIGTDGLKILQGRKDTLR